MEKCKECGQEVQSWITHRCNPIVKEMFQHPWDFEMITRSIL